ncbi:MAG: aldose 1-epimerase family protein [Planctomycetales bacterium]|nr:aldose 1-epimerase family protein [Planctomycetales bacterium]
MKVDLPHAIQLSDPPDLSLPLPNPTRVSSAAGDFLVSNVLLSGGMRTGVNLIIIDSGAVRAAICPTRGMGLWKARIDQLALGWNSPVQGPIHPNFVPLSEANGLGWLDGFDELLVRCGLQSFGAPDFSAQGTLLYPLHGRIGNLPARSVELNLDAEHSLLEISGTVLETRFLQYNLRLTAKYVFAWGQPVIEVHDTVANLSAQETDIQMLYHINIGSPILTEGARLHTSSRRAVARNAHAASDLARWDTYQPPTPGYEEQVYFFQSVGDDKGWATAMLAAENRQTGFAVHYDATTLPFFTQWKNTVAESDGYVTGLEPGTGFPNPRSFEQTKGRLVTLAGGGSVQFQLKLEGVGNAQRLQNISNQVEQTRSSDRLDTSAFDPEWCVPR